MSLSNIFETYDQIMLHANKIRFPTKTDDNELIQGILNHKVYFFLADEVREHNIAHTRRRCRWVIFFFFCFFFFSHSFVALSVLSTENDFWLELYRKWPPTRRIGSSFFYLPRRTADHRATSNGNHFRSFLLLLSVFIRCVLISLTSHLLSEWNQIKFPINGPTSVFLNVEEISEIVRFDSSNNERGNESLRDSVENIRHSAERKQMLEVAFLPPMSLRVSLNPEYLIDPHSYPTPTVIAPWLTCVQRSGLEKRLIGISKDPTYHGLPMVSIWVSWLQENSFDFLALMFETAKVLNLPLGERLPFSFFEEDLDPTMKGDILYVPIFDQDENEDEKNQLGMEPNGSSSSCVSGFATSQHKMRDLIRRQNERVRIIFVENEQQKEIDFKNGTHTCQVCLEEHPGHKFPIENQSLSCKHKTACLECLNGLCRSMILNGNVMEIRCTERGCKGELPIVLVQKICPDLFEKSFFPLLSFVGSLCLHWLS